jgi:aspartokinase/homoserine dehydrogenase 1
MFQDIFIIGATGNIGSELVKQVINNDIDQKCHKNPTRIIGLASSKEYLFNENGIIKSDAISFSKKELNGKSYLKLEEIFDLVKDKKIFFVDVTAVKEDMLNFHLKLINETKHSIVTANKNPLVLCSTKDFQNLTKNPYRYGYRCSVMAGAESINKLVDLADLNDKLISVSGCFSGTLGYLTTKLESGEKLSEIVKEALELGYTEPNPSVDLSGDDVARKILILARSVGKNFDYSDLVVSPFVEEKYLESKTSEELINKLEELNDEFLNKFRIAKDKGNTFRYIGEIDFENNKMHIGLKEVSINSPLGQLNETANKIVIISNTFKENNPYIVESPGAGREVTAQNIRRDLLFMINERVVSFKD